MPSLLISRINGIWQASPANSGVSFVFQTVEGSQETAVQQLAAAMQEGPGATVAGTPEIFEIPEGYTPDEVVSTLFDATDILTFGERIIYGTVGEEFLIDDLEAAGEALMAALL